MISNNRVRVLARQDGVTAGLAEKNYVNSWILYAIYDSELAKDFVFKGGTALSKLYFPEIWRFSEDLDFTASDPGDLQSKQASALSSVEAISGIRFEISNYHVAGDPVEYVQVDVQYDAVLGQRNTTKLDISFDEKLAFDSETHEHSFEDVPTFSLEAYCVEEVLVEKLRSIYQRARARDYYDIYRLLNQEEFVDTEIVAALRRKAEQQGVELDLVNGVPEEDIDSVRAYWNQALDRLVTEKPHFNDVIRRIDAYLRALSETES